MPNHVSTILTVSGDDAQKQAMFEAIKDDTTVCGRATPEAISQTANPSPTV